MMGTVDHRENAQMHRKSAIRLMTRALAVQVADPVTTAVALSHSGAASSAEWWQELTKAHRRMDPHRPPPREIVDLESYFDHIVGAESSPMRTALITVWKEATQFVPAAPVLPPEAFAIVATDPLDHNSSVQRAPQKDHLTLSSQPPENPWAHPLVQQQILALPRRFNDEEARACVAIAGMLPLVAEGTAALPKLMEWTRLACHLTLVDVLAAIADCEFSLTIQSVIAKPEVSSLGHGTPRTHTTMEWKRGTNVSVKQWVGVREMVCYLAARWALARGMHALTHASDWMALEPEVKALSRSRGLSLVMLDAWDHTGNYQGHPVGTRTCTLKNQPRKALGGHAAHPTNSAHALAASTLNTTSTTNTTSTRATSPDPREAAEPYYSPPPAYEPRNEVHDHLDDTMSARLYSLAPRSAAYPAHPSHPSQFDTGKSLLGWG